MGNNIDGYPVDFDVQSDDYLLGSDAKTKSTYSYTIQSIIDLIAVSSTSVVGINVKVVTETSSLNFIQVINADITGQYTFNSGDVGFFDVYDDKGSWKASYLLIKNETGSITFGNSQSQLALTDLIPIRILEEMSRETVGVNGGGTGSKSLVLSNAADYEIQFKGLIDGDTTEVVTDGNNLKIEFTGEIGENNTLVDAETVQGNVQLAGTKDGVALKVKTLKVSGATITDHTDYVEIDFGDKWSATESFTLSASNANDEIWLKNTVPIEITIPADLPADFNCGLIQKSAFQVKFLAGAGTTVLGGKNTMSGQNASVLVTTDPDVPSEVYLLGDLIVT